MHQPVMNFFTGHFCILESVKVDSLDLCSFLPGILFSLTAISLITSIYRFLNKFQWSPEDVDNLKSQVWIPSPKGTGRQVH